jgi:hypothetical protein
MLGDQCKSPLHRRRGTDEGAVIEEPDREELRELTLQAEEERMKAKGKQEGSQRVTLLHARLSSDKVTAEVEVCGPAV